MRKSALILTVLAGTLPATAREPPRLPAFVLAGPYGSPLTTSVSVALPSVPEPVPVLPDRSQPGRSVPDPSNLRVIMVTPKLPTLSALELSKEDEEEARLARPGTLSTQFVKMPNPLPYLKSHSLGPHLRPDAEFDLSDRASIGFMGKLDGFGANDLTSALGRTLSSSSSAAKSSTLPTTRSRDIGFGATFEIKLGQ